MLNVFLILFHIYTKDLPIHHRTCNLIYTDDLCVTVQHPSFIQVDKSIDMTFITAFHLENKEAKRSLKIELNRIELDNTTYPNYFSVTLDLALNNKEHIHNMRMKLATRNNVLNNLVNTKWDTNANTIRKKALTLCYSVTNYADPL